MKIEQKPQFNSDTEGGEGNEEIFSKVVLVKREKQGESKIDLGNAVFNSPVGEIVVVKEEGGNYDTHSSGIAKIPGIGDIKISMYYADVYLNRVLTAHGKMNMPDDKPASDLGIHDYYDPRKKCFIKLNSSESEIKTKGHFSLADEKNFWESIK